MWQCIEKAISDETGQPFVISDKVSITGGDINLSFRISDGARNFFVKVNKKQFASNFESEAYSLQHINALTQISCPNVITLGTTMDKSFLVLSHMDFQDSTKACWYKLGNQLATMHMNSGHGQFGWEHENYIGSTIQPNNWTGNWRTFFSEQRIAWQLQLLSEKSILLGDIDHIAAICHEGLIHHNVTPCLVHGDLWQGNIAFTANGPVIFDPACYYGDREVDIAMTELFGRFPADFYKSYEETYPLKEGYEQRKVIYNFYHILNHANIFGGIYIEQAKAIIKRLFSFTFA